MAMPSGEHTARNKTSRFASKVLVLHDDAKPPPTPRGFKYYERAGHHPALTTLAKRAVDQAALELPKQGQSTYEAGPLLISMHLTDFVEGFVINSLQAQGIGIEEGLKCFVDCFPYWNKKLGRSIPHTFVYTILG